MKINLDSHTVTVPCPTCGQQLKEKLGRLKRDKHIDCPVCGRIAVNTDKLRGIEGSINKELAKIHKTFTIKF